MKQKKPSSLTRILGYAGGHKNLTILGCILDVYKRQLFNYWDASDEVYRICWNQRNVL